MSYTVPVFRELNEKFTTTEALKNYLTSAEGGSLRAVSAGDRYTIFRYVKGTSDMKLAHTRWFRSVIWDNELNRAVCVAPPKAEVSPPPTGEASHIALIQDFLDGTMINVFRTIKNPDVLEVATRTQLGAGGTFYSKKTFREMFQEGLASMGMSEKDLLSMLPIATENSPCSFASLLLQHPEHRVVTRCRFPRVWCVHAGSVLRDGTVQIYEEVSQVEINTKLHLPSYPMSGFRTEADLNSFFKGLIDSKGWFWQGLVLKDGHGHRWRLRNPNYVYLRGLRGSEATSVERFIRLRSERKIAEYLKHYSEDRQVYWDFEQKLRVGTNRVFTGYCNVHKSHDMKLADLPKPIQPFVFRLHAHFLEHLKPHGETVKLKDAIELVNNSALYEQERLMTLADAVPLAVTVEPVPTQVEA